MGDSLPNDSGSIPPLPTFPQRNSGTVTPTHRNSIFANKGSKDFSNTGFNPSPRGSASNSRRSSLSNTFSALAPPSAHSKPGTPLSHARSILKPDEGSPSRTPQLSHGSLLKHEHSLPNGELIAGPAGIKAAEMHQRRKSSSALLTINDDPNRPPATLLARRNSKVIPMMGTNLQFKSFLSKHTVEDLGLIGTQKVVEIDGSLSPAEGFEILLKANILSAPVVDPQPHSVNNRYTGFLDVRDLVSSIVYAHEESSLQNAWTESFMDVSINKKFTNQVDGITAPNVTLTYLSRRNPFRPVHKTDSLLDVAKAMSNQIHRVPVVDENTGHCIAIISQSTIVKYVIEHKPEIETEMKQTLATLQIGLCKVIGCNSDSPAWNAFKILEISNVSGIAVVDRDGKLCGNTSARDLKLFVLNRGNLSLDVPIMDYLAQIRQRESSETERHPSCSVGLQSTIGHVMGLMNATKYHRVFIVDSQSRPIGVLSVTDILRFACADQIQPGQTYHLYERKRSSSINTNSLLASPHHAEK